MSRKAGFILLARASAFGCKEREAWPPVNLFSSIVVANGARSLAVGYRRAVAILEIHVEHLVGLAPSIASHRHIHRQVVRPAGIVTVPDAAL